WCRARARARARARSPCGPALAVMQFATMAPRPLFVLPLVLASTIAAAESLPDAPASQRPGAKGTWTTGRKQGIGTTTDRHSRVWFTLADGALSEVYYPTIDTAQLRSLELVVSDGKTFAERESTATTHEISFVDPRALLYRQRNRAKSGAY